MSAAESELWTDALHPQSIKAYGVGLGERACRAVLFQTGLTGWDEACDDTGGGLDEFWYVVVGGASNVGKALSIDTPIPTPSGWTTMGELRIGDAVFSDTGKPCKVTFTTDVMRHRPCYTLQLGDGEHLVADADHLWRVWEKGFGNKLVQTSEIAGSERCSLPVPGPLRLRKAKLPIDPYLLGYWLGDGSSDTSILTIGLHDIAEVTEILTARGHSVKPITKGRYSVNVGRGRYGLRTALRLLNLLHNKHVPARYLRASESQRRDLLCGLMDSDGCAGRGGHAEFMSTNRDIADGTLELVRSLGYKARMCEGIATLYGRQIGPKYRITFRAYRDKPIFKLKRKWSLQPENHHNHYERRVTHIPIRVTSTESVPVRCIQVSSPSHLYLAGRSMVPTHNTQQAISLAVQALRQKFAVVILTMEEPIDQIMRRVYASIGTLGYYDFTYKHWTHEKAKQLMETTPYLGKLIVNDDLPAYDLRSILGYLDEARDKLFGRPLVVLVDNLQLVKPERGASIAEAATDVSEGLRMWAKKHRTLTIALSQVTSEVLRLGRPVRAFDLWGGSAMYSNPSQIVILDHLAKTVDPQHPHINRLWVLLDKNRYGPKMVAMPVEANLKTSKWRCAEPDELGLWKPNPWGEIKRGSKS